MPAHIQPHFTQNQAYFWQYIWQFFVAKKFTIYTPQIACYLHKNNHNAVLFLDENGYCEQTISGFNDGIAVAFELQTYITSFVHSKQKKFETTNKNDEKKEDDNYFDIECSWNYLGKNEERAHYIRYLHELFWKNQQDEILQNHPAFSAMLEQPWKMSSYATQLGFNVCHPTEFFDKATTNFLDSLQETMKIWTLNPYLVCSDLGSFQWQIKVSADLALNGSIWKQGNTLKQRIEFRNIV